MLSGGDFVRINLLQFHCHNPDFRLLKPDGPWYVKYIITEYRQPGASHTHPESTENKRALSMVMDWKSWHWFWAKIFGQRVPTSGDRAHIDDLLLAYRPDDDEWWRTGAGTDANRVTRIGNLYIFDYGDTPVETKESGYRAKPRDRAKDNAELLAENKAKYSMTSPMASDFGDLRDPETHRKLRRWVEQNMRAPK